jgi:multiple sugar transport system permease protein
VATLFSTRSRASRKDRGKLSVPQILGVMGLLLIILFPIYWMAITGMRPQTETFASTPQFIPSFTAEHYQYVLDEGSAIKGVINSSIIATLATLLAVVVGAPAAYVLARWQFRRHSHVWFWIISNRFILPVVVILPWFLIARALSLIDNHLILILVYQTFSIPLVIWLSVDQFRSVPKEVDEAAAIDGASVMKTFWKINLPNAIPGISVSAILVFIFCWNELLFAQMLTRSEAKTAPVVALSYMSGYDIRWGPMMATATIIVIPVLLFALIFSRNFVKGLAMGAVK